MEPLQKEELEDALKQSQKGKWPGLDGLCYEFYKVTWDVIGEDFFSAMKAVLASALLPESDKHGVTRLIVKVPTVRDLRPRHSSKLLLKAAVHGAGPAAEHGPAGGDHQQPAGSGEQGHHVRRP